MHSTPDAPWGYDSWTHTEVIPKPPPIRWRWNIRVTDKPPHLQVLPGSGRTPAPESEITVQLTADQQVELTISGQDKYGNTVDINGDTVWTSSDESILSVTADTADPQRAIAAAVGPIGTASVTVSNDVNQDGTGDFQGSLAIDVIAGDIAEIEIAAGTPTDKTL